MQAFFAYPSDSVIAGLARVVAESASSPNLTVIPWQENDVSGRPLIEPILDTIDASDFLIADVTYLNFNVAFEIGYAIGRNKRCLLLNNAGLKGDADKARLVGIFDTLGYESYENAASAAALVMGFDSGKPLQFETALDAKAPIYLVETPQQNEAMTVISSRLKKTRLRYRSFNPEEQTRLSALEAAQQVARSFGVLVPLLSKRWVNFDIHNIRAAFVSGLAVGLDRLVLILQEIDGPVHLDVIDICKSYRRPDDITDHIGAFALEVTDRLQGEQEVPTSSLTKLAGLDLGNPVAENEFESLASYFVSTDEFARTSRGESNLVVGRKGTGKTALFIQLRNQKRAKTENVVVDLKPEGYQLVELRDEVLSSLAMGAREHLIVAFWEYIIYLEVIRKLLEKDKVRHVRDHSIFDIYRGFSQKYGDESQAEGGDFSERMMRLSKRITSRFSEMHGGRSDVRLDRNEITNLLYQTDLAALREDVITYLKKKGETWLLFDNLDKGWPPTGLTPDDALILRCLIESARKVQNDLRVHQLPFNAVVFIRDDVYDTLIRQTPDYGKESRVELDWSDPDLLRELVRARLASGTNDFSKETAVDEMWPVVCVSHLPDGSESLQYLIDQSLMRPRNVLKLIDRCKGAAINARHDKIEIEDVEKGLFSYSNDLLIEADREMTDVLPRAENLLYQFIGEPREFNIYDFDAFLELRDFPAPEIAKIKRYFLYFGIFGLSIGGTAKYVWDYRHNLKLIDAAMSKAGSSLRIVLHPAFHPALGVK